MERFTRSTPVPRCLRALARSAHHPPSSTRFIYTGRPPNAQSIYPPARPNYERLALPESNTDPKSDRPSSRFAIPRRLVNHQIPFDRVFVVDPETNKLSKTKHSMRELLETRRQKVVELVASAPHPIVRLTPRSEVEARYRQMKRALKNGSKDGEEPKEVHLTWGVGKADLDHKLRKAGRDLEKGYRIVVVVKVKRSNRPSDRGAFVSFGDHISEVLREVGKEWKEREITDRSMVLSFRKA